MKMPEVKLTGTAAGDDGDEAFDGEEICYFKRGHDDYGIEVT